ncbi:hypothetical protein P154DRAFT_14473 [Amniculicola lignicola CBS 123094]|uniref:Uncharacterized protein n=1 Tax=Amniculicola lignicola CBS 123094 TaxID=1392246 RepID=A0A6A5X5F6_9PLEO|nr:hypothetical protein P154DRAFT_14473 [Amniculicola lignicola CBS 123094]
MSHSPAFQHRARPTDSPAAIPGSTLPQAPIEDQTESPDSSSPNTPEMQYEEPLYTEINIPLPPLPQARPPIPPKSRDRPRARAHTIHSPFSFHRRRPSSPPSKAPPSTEKEMALFLGEDKRESEKTRGAAKGAGWQEMMKEKMKGRKRNQTVDALAIVPAVLVLRAELFTPGKDAGVR